MRKLLGVLICLTMVFGWANTGAVAKAKPKVKAKKVATFSPAVIEAITKRAIAEAHEGFVQFQKKEPDLEPMLKYYHPRFVETYRRDLSANIQNSVRYVETRSIPFEFERVISIKRKSATLAVVDFCYSTSLYVPEVGETVVLDKGTYPISSGRNIEEWMLLKGIWYQGVRTPVADYTKDEECEQAR
jgi:hypothetical protein